MGSFAQIDKNNKVLQTQECDKAFAESQGGVWVEYDPAGISPKNCAGKGKTWDEKRNAFLDDKPFPSWVLNESTCLWEAPTPIPSAKKGTYFWNETTKAWDDKSVGHVVGKDEPAWDETKQKWEKPKEKA